MHTFLVPDMSCGHCTAAIETAVTAADPAAKLSIDLDARRVEITSELDFASLSAVLVQEGFPNSAAD